MSSKRPLPTEEDLEAIREGVRRLLRSSATTTGWPATTTASSRVSSPRHGRGRLAGHHHARGIRRLGPWRDRSDDDDERGGSIGRRRICRSLDHSHQPVRPAPACRHGTHEQKARVDSAAGCGRGPGAFGFTEPDAGLNTTRIKTFAEKVPGGYRVQWPEGVDHHRAGRQQDPAVHPHHEVRGLSPSRPRASPSSTPTSTVRRLTST
jgi:acyl-CoA dehydrogenase